MTTETTKHSGAIDEAYEGAGFAERMLSNLNGAAGGAYDQHRSQSPSLRYARRNAAVDQRSDCR